MPDGSPIAEDETALTGVYAWGVGGSVRFVFEGHNGPPIETRTGFLIRILNEGALEFRIDPRDTITATTRSGAHIEFERDDTMGGSLPRDKKAKIRSREILSLALKPQQRVTDRIVSLEYASRTAGSSIPVQHRFSAPVPSLVVPPAEPKGSDLEPGVNKVRVIASIAADGHIEMIGDPGQKWKTRLMETAATTLARWKFLPARQDGVPVRSLYDASMEFRVDRAVRKVFASPISEVAPKLARLLMGSFKTVVPLPSVRGFAVVGLPSNDSSVRAVRTFLIRYGEASPGRSTWITAVSHGLVASKVKACDCAWWIPQPSGSTDLMDGIASGLQVPQIEDIVLVPQGRSLIPSGEPEPLAAGAWNRRALRDLAAAVLADQPHVEDNGSIAAAAGKAASELPSEHAFLDSDGPLRQPFSDEVRGKMKDPRLLTKVQPEYPEPVRRMRIQGKVELEAVIDEGGNVTDIEVLRSVPGLERPSIEAVCQWKYEPATLDGRPVKVFFIVIVNYSLR